MSDVPVDQDQPRQFGDYTLLRPLGRGGMGQVFLARLRARGLAGVDKICVVKTLRATNDPEYERRFIDEARLIVLLSHKNICPVFDAGCFEGEYYLALEHIAGREVRHLQQACERRGAPLPTAVVLHVMKETLEALDAAHRMVHPLTKEPLRVVHRDVSPQNVMISEEGEVKLIDFGLAVSSQKVEQTAPQVVMGKMAYMAPEQARGEGVDARVDQFAAGIMLYELLTNERYYGSMPIEAMWRMSGVGGHIPERLATLDKDLQDIVMRATAARREQRYPTCGDMRDALTAAELRRGIVAGSREVRAALQEIDSGVVSAPVAVAAARVPTPAPMPSPAEPAPPPEASAPIIEPRRERTRTFRLVVPEGAAERTEIGVVEGLEPGSLITSEELRPVHSSIDTAFDTALQSSLGSDVATETAVPAPAPLTLAPASRPPAASSPARPASPVEATVVVRGSASPSPTPPPPAPAPTSGSRSPIVLAGIFGAAVLAVVIIVVVGSGPGGAPPSPPPVPSAPAVTLTSTPPLDPPPIDAGAPPGPDAGVIEAAPAIIDAGVASSDVFVDAGAPATPEPVVDAGVEPAPTQTRKPPRKPPPSKRRLPPLPQDVLAVQSRFLMEQCNDQTCAHTLFGLHLVKKVNEVGPDKVQSLIRDCYRRCEDARR